MNTNSGTHYFYTDPLAAAWMAKHFSMKFCDRTGLSVSADPSLWYMAERHYQAGSLFIHPDGLHLLEPRNGDLVHIVRGFCSYYKTVDSIATGGGKTVTGIWSDGEHWDVTTKEPLHDWEIIQRDGKPFHWPESEAV